MEDPEDGPGEEAAPQETIVQSTRRRIAAAQEMVAKWVWRHWLWIASGIILVLFITALVHDDKKLHFPEPPIITEDPINPPGIIRPSNASRGG